MATPLLQQTLPQDNATGVAVTANFGLVFSEGVKVGSGFIRIYTSDGTLFHSIAVTDTSQVTFSPTQPARVLINPNLNLVAGTGYYVLIDAGAIENLAGDDFGGIASTTQFNFTTAGTAPGDTTAPLLTGTTPLDDTTGVTVGSNLVLTFNEAVKAGSGNIEIHKVSDGSIAKTIAISDATQISFSGSQLTINPTTDLAAGTGYYVTMTSGVVRDLANNNFAGISSSTTFNFTTAGTADTTAPHLTGTTPLDDATGVAVGTNLVLTFDESVQAGTGNIVIRNAIDGTVARFISVTDATQVSFSGGQVTINPTTDLAENHDYLITIASGVIRDLANNNSLSVAFNFATAGTADTTVPQLTGTSPLDGTFDVAPNANIVLTFNEAVKAGTGSILIKRAFDNSVVYSFDVTDTSQVTFSGSEMTINPTVNLSPDSYYVTLANGVVRDLANNNFAGISAPTVFNFSVSPADTTPPQLMSNSPLDNAVDVDVGADIVLYFDEGVKAGSGNIEIRSAADNSLVHSISITDGSQVSFSFNEVTIDPSIDLDHNESYYITFGSGVVLDSSDNSFAGISSPTALNFSTARLLILGDQNSNSLIGSDDDDILDGGIALDTLTGGLGDDTYVITNYEGGETSVVLQVENSPFGGWFYSGRTLSLPFEDNKIMAVAYDSSGDGIVDGVHLWNYGPVDWWDFAFDTSSIGMNLVPGTYLDATSDFLAGHPFLQVSGNGGASLDYGSFTVTNAVFDYSGPSPTIVSLSISFELHSNFGTQIFGVANYNYAPAGPATLDTIIENPNEGTDTVKVASSYVLPANFENLTLTGGHDLSGTGNSANNVITGNEGKNLIDGKAGADTMIGGDGDDAYIVDNVGDHIVEINNDWWNGFDTVQSSVTHTLDYGVEKLVLTGSANVNGTGNSGDNILIGNAGANILSGAGGNDTYFIDSLADTIVENVGEGTDTLITSLAYTLGNNVDNLTLTGTGNLNGTGNELDNTLIGTQKLPGTGGQNVLTGGGGNDTLNGQSGFDTLIGGLGDDTYIIDNYEGGPTSILLQGQPGEYIGGGEILSLTDASKFTVNLLDNTGDTLVDWVRFQYDDGEHWWHLTFSTAQLGSNLAPGTYLDAERASSESPGHPGIEVYGDGRGASYFSGSFTIAAINIDYSGPAPVLVSASIGFEQYSDINPLPLFGTVNYNYAPAGPAVFDSITENADEGTDTVRAAVSYVLGANLENLTLTGYYSLSGTGNAFNNVITGNWGANVLSGLGGNDTLTGDGADDTFKIVAGGGSDTITDFYFGPWPEWGDVVVLDGFALADFGDVQAKMSQNGNNAVLDLGNGETLTFLNVSSASFTAYDFMFLNPQAPSSPPPFTLPVSGAFTNTINGTRRVDSLTGTSGNNRIDGKQGADTMTGLAGDDTYVVDTSGDHVVETTNNGIDTVISSASSYTLANNVENLTLTGTINHTATGNGLNNLIIASSRPDTINGGAGNDIIQAGTGACVLTGGAGNDIFAFPMAGSQKQITDFHAGEDLVDLRPLLGWYGGSDPVADNVVALSTVAGGVLLSVKATAVGSLQGLVKLTGVAIGDLDIGADILWDA